MLPASNVIVPALIVELLIYVSIVFTATYAAIVPARAFPCNAAAPATSTTIKSDTFTASHGSATVDATGGSGSIVMNIVRGMTESGIGTSAIGKKIQANNLTVQAIKDANYINPELLTVSVEEQVKIQGEKKKDLKTDIEQKGTNKLGQQLLGEQLMIAINMKNKKDLV